MLIERARTGDAAAFEELAASRAGPMTRTAMAILGREAEALAAVGDALVIAWRELASLRDVAAIDTWLVRILVHRCKRGLRRVALPIGREVPTSKPSARAQPAAETARVSAPAGTPALEQAFDRLSIDERTILVLHHLDGRPPAEAAAVLRIGVRTVESRLLSARHALQQSVAQGMDAARQEQIAPGGAGLGPTGDGLGPTGAGLGPTGDGLGAMLEARADRLPATATATVMAHLGGELGTPKPGGILGWLPVGNRAGSMSGWVGWAIALATAALVIALLGGR